MKKTISVVLTLVLMLSLFGPAAAALAEAASVEGVWYLNTLMIGEAEMSPSAMGLEMSMTLEADGTALMQATEEEDETATWSQEGETITVTSEDEVIVFTQKGETLVAVDEEATMIFGREKAEVEAFVAPAVLEDVALSDFDGAWAATYIELMGMQLPVATLGINITLTIDNGNAAIVTLDEAGEHSGEVKGVFEGNTLTLNAGDDGSASMVLVLHEDGSMSFGDEEGTIYFEKS